MELTISREGATARRLYPAFEAIHPPRVSAPPRELFIRESLAGLSSSFWQLLQMNPDARANHEARRDQNQRRSAMSRCESRNQTTHGKNSL